MHQEIEEVAAGDAPGDRRDPLDRVDFVSDEVEWDPPPELMDQLETG